jgi:molecular chaperone IbpA
MVSTAMDLFKDPFFIGIDRELDRFLNVYGTASRQSYPPYDLVKLGEDDYILTMAVAGFSRKDLDITVANGTLTVTGEISDSDEDLNYIHKGIASRKFTRTFALGEYMEVKSADMENGMLNISVKRIIPEDKKPKQITIK